MFILSLAIFTLILTVFENIFLALVALIIVLMAYFIRQKLKKSHPDASRHSLWHPGGFLRSVLLITWAFVLSLSSILIKNYTYSQKQSNIILNSTWLISQNLGWPQGNYFVGIWQISDIYSYQKYIFQDNNGREFFLKSNKKFQIWDIIWLNWYVSYAYTWAKNIFNLKFQRQNLFQKPNLSGFFAYEFDYPKRLMMKGFYGTIFEQNSVDITPSIFPSKGRLWTFISFSLEWKIDWVIFTEFCSRIVP